MDAMKKKTMADYTNPSDYKPVPLARKFEFMFCPHCETRGQPTNRYLFRCQNVDCGRYF